jgi:DNA-binding NarL/FixJ family response regulator
VSIRILIADDYLMIRRRLRVVLESQLDVEVIAGVSDGRAAVRCCQELMPDVVLMDVSMPRLNGIEATRQIVHLAAQIKVLAVSAHSNLRTVRGMLSAGASGYVLKNRVFEELVDAVRAVVAGHTYLSATVRRGIVTTWIEHLTESGQSLADEERAVLKGLHSGKCSDTLASDLCAGPGVVKQICNEILSRTGEPDLKLLVRHVIPDGEHRG